MVLPSELEELKKEIYEISGKVPFITHYGCYEFLRLDLQTPFNQGLLKKSPLYSLSGIGFGQGFKKSLEKAGVKIDGSFVLKDHKNYNPEEIENIFSKTARASVIITTAKDAVKLNLAAADEFKERIAVLKVKPVFETGKQQWEKEILKSLRSF
jgi:tetraacyldisaccharide 4'-kinase